MSKVAIVPALKDLTVWWGKQKESAPKRGVTVGAVGTHGETVNPTVRSQGWLGRVNTI